MCILKILRLHCQSADRTSWELPSKRTKTTLRVILGLYVQTRQKVFRVLLKFYVGHFQGAPTGCIVSTFRVTLSFTYKTGSFSQSYPKSTWTVFGMHRKFALFALCACVRACARVCVRACVRASVFMCGRSGERDYGGQRTATTTA